MTDDHSSKPTPLAAGEVIAGRYRIEGPLGHGGMARVYRTYDLELDEEVALKVLSHDLVDDAEATDQFRREIRLARRVIHPNVCRIHDFGRTGELLFVTMEVIEGETLGQIMSRRSLGEVSERLQIFRDILIGLRAAHQTGIVHLDIKPQNIMITADGRTVVMDFGLAGERGKAGGIRSDGTLVGTPVYMPPERFEARPADARTDIYALGVLLYELMTGHVPFDGTLTEIIDGHMNRQVPDLRLIDPDLHPAIPEAIDGMLQKDPERRFASVDQVLQVLAAVREDEDRKTAVLALGDPHLQGLVEHHLRAMDLEIRGAADGEQVIEQVLRETPDVVLVDVELEKIDGFRVVEVLRRFPHTAALPVYVLARSKNPGYTAYAKQLGVTSLVRRPFASRELAREVRARIDRSQEGR